MKSKMILTGLIFSIALTLYVAAQSEPTREQGVGSYYYVRRQAEKAPVTLCIGPIMATEGTAKCLYHASPSLEDSISKCRTGLSKRLT